MMDFDFQGEENNVAENAVFITMFSLSGKIKKDEKNHFSLRKHSFPSNH